MGWGGKIIITLPVSAVDEQDAYQSAIDLLSDIATGKRNRKTYLGWPTRVHEEIRAWIETYGKIELVKDEPRPTPR